MYLITSYDRAENDIGRKADKNRKIYNGMLKNILLSVPGSETTKEEKRLKKVIFATGNQGKMKEIREITRRSGY